MTLQVRLLGPVELRVDDEALVLGAAKRRAVLAGLAIESNRSVSLDRLAEMVWSEVPPASAVANLRSHAAALRRMLGSRLVARPNAYELRLAPDELDVTEFHQLVGEGRAALAAENSAAAVSRLAAALALWRGSAADGLPRGTALDNRWASLDEQRLQVFEELVGARLTLGEHGELLPGLRHLLAAHPLRERAWGQLMLALYRCGDVPAALMAYRDARAALHEQLGVEPGEELQRLHRAMLDRAPDLSYGAPPSGQPRVRTVEVDSGRSPASPLPRELPPDLVTFVGRTREIAEVLAAVTGPTPATVVVTGVAGSGKSALAVRVAHAVAPDFPDGQIFVDLAYQSSFTGDEVLARVLRALGVDAAEVPEQASERSGRLRSLLVGRRLLIVVDGVSHAAQVRPLIPASSGPALIVVAQRHLRSLDGVRRVVLYGLPAADGGALVGALAGAERLAAAPAEAAELVRLCAGSPLALRIAASRLAGRPSVPLADIVAELRNGRHRLDWLADDDLSVRARLDVGYAAVRDDEVAGRIVALLGAAPAEATLPEDIAAHLGASMQRVWQALEALLDAHLVCVDESAGYYLSPLVRDYAAELAEVPAPPNLHPLPTWYLDLVAAQRRPTAPPSASRAGQSAAASGASGRCGAGAIDIWSDQERVHPFEVNGRQARGSSPQRIPVLASLIMLLAGAYATDDEGPISPSQTAAPPRATAAATGPATTSPGTLATPSAAATRPIAPDGGRQVMDDEAGFTTLAQVGRVLPVLVTSAPAEALPVMGQIEVGDHSADGFTRITFAFRGPTPIEDVGNVDRFEPDGDVEG